MARVRACFIDSIPSLSLTYLQFLPDAELAATKVCNDVSEDDAMLLSMVQALKVETQIKGFCRGARGAINLFLTPWHDCRLEL